MPSLLHNGCDTLMLGFDYELRRRGFAGNSCQIILELAAPVDEGRLRERVAAIARENPILGARPVRGLRPRWEPTGRAPKIRAHRLAPGLAEKLFNEPLDLRRGELLRFDLFDRTVIFTWAHALMDAKSAEYFLALVGDEKNPEPEPGQDWYAQRGVRAGGVRDRARHAWQELRRLDEFRKALPVSLGTRRPPTMPFLKYHVSALTREETARARANAAKCCGFLGETNFHLAATLMELHALQERAGGASPSYVAPIPVSVRPKGTRAPLFSNQVTMMLHQFLPSQLGTLPEAVAAVKARKTEFLRDDQIDAGIALAQLFRRLPFAIYMRMVKHALDGEICSLFFADTAGVDTALQTFQGVAIEKVSHVPAVTMPPGLGVVFHHFKGLQQFTVVYAEGVLTDAEAADFAARLRGRVLNP